jgi:hypothetical protein
MQSIFGRSSFGALSAAAAEFQRAENSVEQDFSALT